MDESGIGIGVNGMEYKASGKWIFISGSGNVDEKIVSAIFAISRFSLETFSYDRWF